MGARDEDLTPFSVTQASREVSGAKGWIGPTLAYGALAWIPVLGWILLAGWARRTFHRRLRGELGVAPIALGQDLRGGLDPFIAVFPQTAGMLALAFVAAELDVLGVFWIAMAVTMVHTLFLPEVLRRAFHGDRGALLRSGRLVRNYLAKPTLTAQLMWGWIVVGGTFLMVVMMCPAIIPLPVPIAARFLADWQRRLHPWRTNPQLGKLRWSDADHAEGFLVGRPVTATRDGRTLRVTLEADTGDLLAAHPEWADFDSVPIDDAVLPRLIAIQGSEARQLLDDQDALAPILGLVHAHPGSFVDGEGVHVVVPEEAPREQVDAALRAGLVLSEALTGS